MKALNNIERKKDEVYLSMCKGARRELDPYYEELMSPQTVNREGILIPNIHDLHSIIPNDIIEEVIYGGLRTSAGGVRDFDTLYWDNNSLGWKQFITCFEIFWLLVFMWHVHDKVWNNEKLLFEPINY